MMSCSQRTSFHTFPLVLYICSTSVNLAQTRYQRTNRKNMKSTKIDIFTCRSKWDSIAVTISTLHCHTFRKPRFPGMMGLTKNNLDNLRSAR